MASDPFFRPDSWLIIPLKWIFRRINTNTLTEYISSNVQEVLLGGVGGPTLSDP